MSDRRELISFLLCVQCKAVDRNEVPAQYVFMGWSVCGECFIKMDEAAKKLKQKSESKIIKPGG